MKVYGVLDGKLDKCTVVWVSGGAWWCKDCGAIFPDADSRKEPNGIDNSSPKGGCTIIPMEMWNNTSKIKEFLSDLQGVDLD